MLGQGKPEGALVEVRSGPDTQVGHLTWAQGHKAN